MERLTTRHARRHLVHPPTVRLVVALAGGLALVLAAPAFAGPPCDCGDQDGIPDVIDNCVNVNNPLQCDTDNDGYGNACDGDFSQDGDVDGQDFNPLFLNAFGGGGSGSLDADMDCNGSVDGADFNPLFLDQFTAGAPGPSGLACAGTVPCP